MTVSEPTTERDRTRAALDMLEQARAPGPNGLAFDADGTLWSGDVGEDLFQFACSNDLLRMPARDALAGVAVEHGVDADGSSSAIAARLFAAYRRGVVRELRMCEIMTWSYAGFAPEELAALARDALEQRGLRARARRFLDPFFAYARREGLRTVVISASPRIIVAEGLRLAGVEVDAIAGSQAVVAGGLIQPDLAAPVPYGPEKPLVGARLLEGHHWLATFGDNVFDMEMLRTAKIGFAVCPKPALSARLGELTNTIVLE